MDMCLIGRVVVDASLHTQRADEAFFTYFGNDVIYSIRRTISDEDYPRLIECLEAADDGSCQQTVLRMRGINGLLRWVLADIRRTGDADGEKLYSISFSDVFSLEKLVYTREKSLSDYRTFLSLTSDLAFDYSFETKHIRIFMFDTCRELVLFDEELSKWQERVISSGFVLTRYIETFNSLCRDIRNGVYRFDYELESSILTNGGNREMTLFRGITRFYDPFEKRVSGIISVISSRQKTKDVNLALETNKDSLSGLLNKRAVSSYASGVLTEKPGFSVNLVIIDIDSFTRINSSYGHLFGDEVIHTIGTIIKHEIGSRGVAGRISGGGFLLVLEGTRDEEDLRGILRAIRTNIELVFTDRFENFRLTCSMGVSTYPVDSSNYDELFMQADKALYLAQEKGGNRYVIYDINKHGPVEKDPENKVAFLGGRKDTNEKLNFAAGLSESLVFGRLPDLSVLLEQIRSQFSIDDVCIFAGNDMGLIHSCGNATSRSADYLLKNGYSERFSGDSIFVIDNVNELEGRDDNAFRQLSEEKIGGAVQYLITEDGIIKGLISFCYIGRFKKWSVADISYFTIIGRTVAALLKKNAYI